MSKQCRVFLLPSDVERLLEELRSQADVRVISRVSSSLEPVELRSPFSEYVSQRTATKFVHLDCCLIPTKSANVRMRYLAKQDQWTVSELSEAIEFTGCDYDMRILRPGRLYVQTDQLLENDLWPKRAAFLKWADKVFRSTKQHLERSKTLNAYVGRDAVAWERGGGHFEQL